MKKIYAQTYSRSDFISVCLTGEQVWRAVNGWGAVHSQSTIPTESLLDERMLGNEGTLTED